ncbi:MAG: polysaccharide deacetylase family protein [Acetobacteraceae bacterium]
MARLLESLAEIGRQPPNPRSRWRPAPALVGSFALHAAALPALLAWPAAWPQLLALLIADHATLSGLCFLPRSSLLGPSIGRLPAAAAARGEVALTFDDGPDPAVTPRVLDLLDRHGARASFFCIGRRALAHSALVRDIVQRGHSVENHSFRHAGLFAAWSLPAIRRDLLHAQTVLTATAGVPPQFVRAPFGIRSPLFDPALAGTGLRHVAWTARGRDTVCGDPRTVLDRLTRRLTAGNVLLLHDGTSAVTPGGEKVVLTVLPALLRAITARGLHPVTLRTALLGAGQGSNGPVSR